jgi:hypothetical protein
MTATPAGPMTVSLSQNGDSVTGTASFGAITYQVAGSYTRPIVTLMLTFSPPSLGSQVSVQTLAGRAAGPKLMILGSDSTHFYKQ